MGNNVFNGYQNKIYIMQSLNTNITKHNVKQNRKLNFIKNEIEQEKNNK